jgi:phage shock protein C
VDETTQNLRDQAVDGRLPDVDAAAPPPVPPLPPVPEIPPFPALPPAEPWTAALPAPPRRSFRLRRSRTDKMVAGVCGGLAAELGVDAALLRIALVALTLLGVGTGAVLYLAVWLLAPVEG